MLIYTLSYEIKINLLGGLKVYRDHTYVCLQFEPAIEDRTYRLACHKRKLTLHRQPLTDHCKTTRNAGFQELHMKAYALFFITFTTAGAVMGNASLSEQAPSSLPKPALQQNCAEYIQSGTWNYMFIKDPNYETNYQFNEWRLSLVPTSCGRTIDSSETAYMFYEIVKKFGQNEHWTNNRGMINQLTCHLAIARNKDTWNLEPWRPYVGYDKTVAAGCNPTVPDPDPAWH